jgi:hypothetical protein
MAVAFDAYTSTNLSNSANPSATHTPAGTPKGILLIGQGSSDTTFGTTAATYGGVTCTSVLELTVAIGNGGSKNRSIHIFFLGSSIPTGAQTATITRTGTGYARLHCLSLTADDDTEVVDSDSDWAASNNTSYTVPTLSLSSRTCYVAGAWWVIASSGTSAASGNTLRNSYTLFSNQSGGLTYDTVGTSDVSTHGVTCSSAWGSIAGAAISEVAASGTTINGTNVPLTLTEYAASISLDRVITAAAPVALTISEYAATTALGVILNASNVALTILPNAATVQLDISIAAALTTLTVTENAATVELSGDIQAQMVALNITEYAATINDGSPAPVLVVASRRTNKLRFMRGVR